jgi:hypothetical protein
LWLDPLTLKGEGGGQQNSSGCGGKEKEENPCVENRTSAVQSISRDIFTPALYIIQ